jgi:nucleoid-associated protein YgaU
LFEPSSRYSSCEDAIIEIDEGMTPNKNQQQQKSGTNKRQVLYKKRRILPNSEEMTLLQEVTVRAGDRLDLISNHILGDPQQFWRICDANDAMYPPELTSKPGKVLKISSPWQ